jgi:hypothetical protein
MPFLIAETSILVAFGINAIGNGLAIGEIKGGGRGRSRIAPRLRCPADRERQVHYRLPGLQPRSGALGTEIEPSVQTQNCQLMGIGSIDKRIEQVERGVGQAQLIFL